MLDNKEINRILEKLENMQDEALAVNLLQDFNRTTKELGKLLLNLDKTLSNEEWKTRCDHAKQALDAVVAEIEKHG